MFTFFLILTSALPADEIFYSFSIALYSSCVNQFRFFRPRIMSKKWLKIPCSAGFRQFHSPYGQKHRLYIHEIVYIYTKLRLLVFILFLFMMPVYNDTASRQQQDTAARKWNPYPYRVRIGGGGLGNDIPRLGLRNRNRSSCKR